MTGQSMTYLRIASQFCKKDLERGERTLECVGKIVRKLSRSGVLSKALSMKEKGSKIQ